jgi:hypothetical protein
MSFILCELIITCNTGCSLLPTAGGFSCSLRFLQSTYSWIAAAITADAISADVGAEVAMLYLGFAVSACLRALLFDLHELLGSKGLAYLPQQGQKPRFACFVPFASAHAQRRKVMRINALGLLHRLHMDTLPTDVHMLLLPVLQWHTWRCLHLVTHNTACCQLLRCSRSTLRSSCVASHGVNST